MRIRVPTGFKELKLTAQQKGFILYTCTKCGKTQLNEMHVTTTSVAQYHVIGGEKARITAENEVRKMAAQNLNILDNELFDAVNIQRDYSKISEPVICPNCGEEQIWSTIPKPWWKESHDAWIIGIFFSGILSFAISSLAGWFGLIPLSLLVLLLVLPVRLRQKRKKALKILQEMSFQPPKYYNHSNIHELVNLKNI